MCIRDRQYIAEHPVLNPLVATHVFKTNYFSPQMKSGTYFNKFLVTRHQEEMRSTTHGIDFEEEFRAFVQREAQKAGDIFVPTGTRPDLSCR